MLTPDRFDHLLGLWSAQFQDKRLCLESAQAYVKTAIAPDEHRFNSWMENALAKDQLLARAVAVADPLAESHPSTFELSEERRQQAIAAGDLHDFSDPLLPPDRHAAICPRCQAGARSRHMVDARAAALGKKSFPGFGNLMERFQDRIQRCPDCQHPEDELAPDDCQNPLWHLPDIYLVTHPGHTLDDLGQTGPFMRQFLRQQRSA